MNNSRHFFFRALACVMGSLWLQAVGAVDYTVQVTAEPEEYQVDGQPVYETLTKSAGSTCFFDAVEGFHPLSDGVRAYIAGYRIDTWSGSGWTLGEPVYGTLQAFFEQPAANARVVWLWTNQVEITVVSAITGEKVSLDGSTWAAEVAGWYTLGETVTVWGGQGTARNYCWSHLPADTVYADDKCRVVSFTAADPRTLVSRQRPGGNSKTFLVEEGSSSWENPEVWYPVGVPGPENTVIIPPGSTIVASNAINIASLELQGSATAPSKLTFAARDAVHRVSGSVTLGAYTVMTHEKNWHWYAAGGGCWAIAVNVADTTDANTFRNVYSKTPPEVWYRLNLEVGGDMTIAAGAKIDVSDAGFGPGWSPTGYNVTANSAGNAPVHAGSASCGYKFVDGTTLEKKSYAVKSGIPVYGSVRHPVLPGSGANDNAVPGLFNGSAGGGVVHLAVAGELTIDGEILSRSSPATGPDGVGAGGSVWLEASRVTGAGVVDVRGGDFTGKKYSPNGSAGRIAVYQTEATENPSSLTLRAGTPENLADHLYVNGANGTIYHENANDIGGCGELVVDYGGFKCFNLTNNAVVSGVTLDSSICRSNNCALITAQVLGTQANSNVFRKITVSGNGILTVARGVTLTTYALDTAGAGMVTEGITGYGTINTVAAPTSGRVMVTGEPSEYKIGSEPAYAGYQTKDIDSVTVFTAPSGTVELSDGIRASVVGYRIDRNYGGEWVQGESVLGSRSCSYRQLNAADARVVWLWQTEVRVSVTSGISGGKISFDNSSWSSGSAEGWFAVGAPVRIWGYQTESKSLVWTGAPADATYPDRRYRELDFAAPSSPVAISVNERPVGKVIVSGVPVAGYAIDGEPEYGSFFFANGEEGDFTAPSGSLQLDDNHRVRVAGYRFGAGSLVAALTYHHVQSGLAENNLYWVWTNEYRVAVSSASEFASERYVRIGSSDWSFETAAEWVLPGTVVTVQGGKDAERSYQWSGLPAGATFDDDAKRRVATFTMPDGPLALSVRMIPQPGVYVAGEPLAHQIGSVPAYGVTVVADGDSRDFAAPTGTLPLEAGVRTRVAGYRLEIWDDANLRWISPSLHLDELTYTHVQSGVGRKRLTWIWTNEVEYAVTSVTEGGRVSVDGGPWCESTNAWLRIGALHTIKGSEDSSNIHRWEGLPANATFDTESEKWTASFVPSEPGTVTVNSTSASVKTWVGGRGDWNDPNGWNPVGVPAAGNDVLILPGSEVVVSNAINIASLELQGANNATSKLTFAAKDAVHRVSGSVTLGAYTVMTHEKNWHWYLEASSCRPIPVNLDDTVNPDTFKNVYSTTPPEIWYRLDLEVGGDMTIAADAKIDVSEAGYGPGWSPAGHNTSSPADGSPPVHAGSASCGIQFVGGTVKNKEAYAKVSSIPVYGSVRRPVTPGSGAPYTIVTPIPVGCAGGGMVHLVVGGELEIAGEILSRSSVPAIPTRGSGAGGSVWLEAARVTGAGVVDVRGGDLTGKRYSPNGSAGRIAVYQAEATENPSSLTLRAGTPENLSDHLYVNGANGSIYLENANDYPGRGELVVDYGGFDCFTVTNVSEYTGVNRNPGVNCLTLTADSLDGKSVFRKITVRGKGMLNVPAGVSLTTYALDDLSCGVLMATTTGYLPASGSHHNLGSSAASYGTINIVEAPPPVKLVDFSVVGNDTCTYRAYQYGDEVSTHKVESNAVVRIVVAPAKGYCFEEPPEGWSDGDVAGTVQRDIYAIADPTVVTLPSAFAYEPSPLPGGYVAVDYIESTGKQYIETPFGMQDNLAADMRVAFTSLDATAAMLAAQNGSSREYFVFLSRASGQSNFSYGIGTDEVGNYVMGAASANHIYDLSASVSGHESRFSADGVSALARVASQVTASSTKLYLFALNQSGTAKNFAKARLYSCRIYRNGTIIAADFVPAKEDSSGAYGLYDLIGGRFYPSNSSTAFYGPEAPPPAPKPKVSFSLVPAEHASYRLYTNGVEVASVPSKVMTNATVKVIMIPDEDYEYTTMPEGWSEAPKRLQIQRTFTADTDPYSIVLPSPQYFYRERGILDITAEPAEYQIDGEPVYTNGMVFIDGRGQTFVAPAESYYVNPEETIRRQVTGYRVDTWDGDGWVLGEVANVIAYEHVQEGAAHKRLVWIWQDQVKVEANSGISGDPVSLNGADWSMSVRGWCPVGGSIRIFGGRSEETYYGWTGVPDAGVAYEDDNHRILILSATEPVVISTYEGEPEVELPDGYERVEYIRSTGEQYVDTGVKMQDLLAANLLVEFTSLESSDFNGPCMFGAYDRVALSSETLVSLTEPENGSCWRIALGTSASTLSLERPGAVQLGVGYRIKASVDYGTVVTSVNGLQTTNGFAGVERLHKGCETTEYLFARNYSGTPNSMASAKLYSARIYTNVNVLVRQYVPCRETASGRYGLYEVVEGAFVPSATAVGFLGPEVAPDPDPHTVLPKRIERTADGCRMFIDGEHAESDVLVVGSPTLDGEFTAVGFGYLVETNGGETVVTITFAHPDGVGQYFFMVLVK